MGRQDDVMDARRRGNHIATSIQCAQCGSASSGHWVGWRAYRSDSAELDEPPALAFFCPTCAIREFGR